MAAFSSPDLQVGDKTEAELALAQLFSEYFWLKPSMTYPDPRFEGRGC
jgi:hypothetical protein